VADFGKFRITNDGLDLEYKAQAGKELKFSKFVLGDGNYSGAIKELKKLVNPIMEVDIKRLNVQTLSTNKKVQIGFNLDTNEITTGFYLREIGLYAIDPDTQSEVLVFYGNSGETADYIASNTSTTVSEKLIDLELYISDVENITAVIDNSLVFVTEEEFNKITQNKVDKEEGKGLSTNDFTDADKTKLNGLNTTIKTSKITTTKTIAENTNYTIPLTYKVGNNSLDIFYMGEKLIKDTHYKEVGTSGNTSNKIQFYNWGQSVPSGRVIEFVVKGVYTDES
jgi:phage-related tail fiber protein